MGFDFIVIFVLSYFLYIMFECPIANLLRIIQMKPSVEKKCENNNYIENDEDIKSKKYSAKIFVIQTE